MLEAWLTQAIELTLVYYLVSFYFEGLLMVWCAASECGCTAIINEKWIPQMYQDILRSVEKNNVTANSSLAEDTQHYLNKYKADLM